MDQGDRVRDKLSGATGLVIRSDLGVMLIALDERSAAITMDRDDGSDYRTGVQVRSHIIRQESQVEPVEPGDGVCADAESA